MYDTIANVGEEVVWEAAAAAALWPDEMLTREAGGAVAAIAVVAQMSSLRAALALRLELESEQLC